MLKRLRRHRRLLHVLPAALVVGVGVAGLLTTAASGSPHPQAAKATTGADPISYSTPSSKAQIQRGGTLFAESCASCHGPDAGGTSVAPNLQGLGAGTVDFWVSTGRMPLQTADAQANRKPPLFDRSETLDIAAYVASRSPGGVGIPSVDLSSASLSDGQDAFTLNCAACHTITGAGDALANGAYAPSLHYATKTQVAEAMRTGPGNMPRFGTGTLTDKEVADIAAYVTGPIQHPDNAGGAGLGGIGPVAEGFVALLVGVGGSMLITFWLGERA